MSNEQPIEWALFVRAGGDTHVEIGFSNSEREMIIKSLTPKQAIGIAGRLIGLAYGLLR